jgi:hypothetical protein
VKSVKRKSKGLISKRSYQHPPPDTSTFRIIEKHFGQKMNKAFGDKDFEFEEVEDKFVFAVKRKVARQVIKNVEEIVLWFKDEYKRYLIPDKEIFYHKKWIWKNNKISENLEGRRNKHLIPLMNYLCNHRLGLKESESLADDIDAGAFYKETQKGKDMWHRFVLVIPDYEDIEDKLEMSPSLIQKYLKGMGDAGFIKPIRKVGSHGQIVYALGYYLVYPDKDGVKKPKPNWFLKGNKEMKQALREFYRPE